jgi:hypothetical protein
MAMPIVLQGVIHGKTITLDEETCLPDGYRVTLQLMLEPGEGLRLSFGAWADMTPEQTAEMEKFFSDLRGRPVTFSDGDSA